VKRWRADVALHVAGLVAGALLVASALVGAAAALNIVPPEFPIGLVGATAAAAAAGFIRPLPSSPWRVPRSWVRLGDTAYSAIFGFVLGLGFATSVPSSGFYFLVAWALSAQWATAILVFGLFAVARATPLIVAGVLVPPTVNTAAYAWRARRWALRAAPLEAILLTLIAAMLLA
jgi:hypothetical protein